MGAPVLDQTTRFPLLIHHIREATEHTRFLHKHSFVGSSHVKGQTWTGRRLLSRLLVFSFITLKADKISTSSSHSLSHPSWRKKRSQTLLCWPLTLKASKLRRTQFYVCFRSHPHDFICWNIDWIRWSIFFPLQTKSVKSWRGWKDSPSTWRVKRSGWNNTDTQSRQRTHRQNRCEWQTRHPRLPPQLEEQRLTNTERKVSFKCSCNRMEYLQCLQFACETIR